MPWYSLANELVVGELLGGGVAPVFLAHAFVQPLGAGFGEAVGERLEHDRAVVVVRGLELGQLLLDAEAGGDGEGARPVSRALRCDEIGETVVRLARWAFMLLAQVMRRRQHCRARLVGVQLDIVADAVCRPQAETALAEIHFSAISCRASPARPRRRCARLRRPSRRRDLRVGAGEIPGLEERTPVDVLGEVVARSMSFGTR